MTTYKTLLLAIAATAALASFDTLAAEPDESVTDKSKVEKLQPASERLRHRDRAVTKDDFKPLTETSPSVEVGRAEIAASESKEDDSDSKKTPKQDKPEK